MVVEEAIKATTKQTFSTWKPEVVNAAFDLTCPELQSKYARYPMNYAKWANLDEKDKEGKPMFIPSEKDVGLKMDYVWCKYGTGGKGYYHFLTKSSHVNLYSKLDANSPPMLCCGGDRKLIDAHDTTRLIVYGRSRANRPSDDHAHEAAIQHMSGTKLNPLHGIKG